MTNSAPKRNDSSLKPTAPASTNARLAEVVAELRKREALRNESFLDFIPRVNPDALRPDHLAPLSALLDRIARGERVRFCLSIPPQHGKTFGVLCAIAWLLGRHPSRSYIYATYSQDQSDDKSHTARAIARRAGVDLAADRANLRQWRTTKGGGCLFTAVDGPGSGQPASLALVDDPYKGRSEAMSATVRAHVERWFSSVIMMRGQEGMSLGIVHTRWVEDDLIGRITAGAFGEGWEVINLPMLADDDGSPSLRPYATATRVLNPQRKTPTGELFGWTLEGARRQALATPEADAESLLQGRPRKRVDGALWSWESITSTRVTVAPAMSRVIVAVDPNAADEAHAAKADDAGVVTIGRGVDTRGYVLADATAHTSVEGWARRAIAAYRTHHASSIVAEKNHGGAMVEKTIRAVLLQEALDAGRREPEHIPVKLVTVKGDKRGRAESARELYADPTQGRGGVVSHVGHHARLEKSMTAHDFATSKRSPGDLDALSLGLAELMLSTADAPVYTDRPRPHMKTRL